ncbi:MAG: discoidin domain-containing protein, partial [Armatimonadetes bacterium]|nr:discoidin domain-containing protein [Armatimonadota bacterium]
MRRRMTLLCFLWLPVLGWGQPPPDNVALDKPYTLSPAPNYALCLDPGDATQLTDGVYVDGHFWTRPGTVGWSGGGLRFITIDLGEVLPIAGLSLNTAAGVAEVYWPRSILIFVSDDGQAWHSVGDLTEMVSPDFLPEYGNYAVRKLAADTLETHGRYVQLAVQPDRNYAFVDEIEVHRGPDALLANALPGPAVANVAEQMKLEAFGKLVRAQLRRDLAAAREDIGAPGLAEAQRTALTGKADRLAAQIADMPPIGPEGFRAVLPMTDLERAVFALQAEVWRAQGKPALRAWHTHRWDPLAPSDEPPAGADPPALAVRLMNGERRADVLNLTNAATADAELVLRVEGLPGGPNPPYLGVAEVLHTGTRDAASVAAALPAARREGSGFGLSVPSGMTAQAWVQFRPTDLPAGEHAGTVVVEQAGEIVARVALRLTVSRLALPAEATLLLGGWDYSDGVGTYGVTAENREAFIEYLQDHRVNVPWATGGVMPEGTYDDDGNLLEEPDTTRFDEWVGQWPDARLYMVYVTGRDAFAGAEVDTEQFATRVGNWARFWAQHMLDLGLEAGQLGYLSYDEPS